MAPPPALPLAAAALLLAPTALADDLGCTQGRGCDGFGDDPFDCEAGLAKASIGWSENKKTWCCKNHLKGCSGTCTQGGGCSGSGTDPFDCKAGEAGWDKGWSDVKKDWCCQNFQTGCGGSVPTSSPDVDVSTVDVEPVVPTNQKYNCSAGTYLWERGWSESKKKYCCTFASIGCAPSPSPYEWVHYPGRSCGDGRGGNTISADTDPVHNDMWLQDCMETCIHTGECEGFVVTRKVNSLGQQGSAPCYLRKEIDPKECPKDSEYDLYLYRGQDSGSLGSSSIAGASSGQSFQAWTTQGPLRFIIFSVLVLIVIALVLGLACWCSGAYQGRFKREPIMDPMVE